MSDQIAVKCDRCGHQFVVPCDELGSELEDVEVGSQEFSTAPKIVYVVDCPECKHVVRF